MLLHKLFLVGGGGGPMECGEVGSNQYRETAGPKIDPSKALIIKGRKNDANIILYNTTVFIHFRWWARISVQRMREQRSNPAKLNNSLKNREVKKRNKFVVWKFDSQ